MCCRSPVRAEGSAGRAWGSLSAVHCRMIDEDVADADKPRGLTDFVAGGTFGVPMSVLIRVN